MGRLIRGASLKSSDYYWPEPEPVALFGGSAYTRVGLNVSMYGTLVLPYSFKALVCEAIGGQKP